MKWGKFLNILILIVIIAFSAGCTLSGGGDRKNTAGNNTSSPPQVKNDNQQTPPVDPQPTKDTVEVTLYFGDDQAMYVKPEKRLVEKGGKPMGELLIEELIQGPQTKGLNKTIPEGTRLISLEVADNVAFVNFSQEIKTKHWGGSAGEAMTVQSIVQTLTQLPEIKKIQFLIEGKKEEAIWGHGYTGEPIGPAKDIVAK